MRGKLDFGTPTDALLKGESSLVKIATNEEGVTITLISKRGKEIAVSLVEGKNKDVFLKSEEDSLTLIQKRFAQSNWDYGMYLGTIFNTRFKAVLKLDENDNLILENYDASGARKLRLMKSCILPRVN
jgi:hypothetical protein